MTAFCYINCIMRKLYRSRYDKKISGVCGGIGNYFSIDPVLIRLIMIFLIPLTAVVVMPLIYLGAALILPLEPPNTPAIEFRRIYRSTSDSMIAGICGGLAKLFRIDTSIVRLLVLIATFLTGLVPMLTAYLVGWIIIPEKRL